MFRNVLNTLKKEPTLFLLKKMWRFSGDERPKVVLFTFFFLCSNLVALLGPYIFSKLVNEIQKNGIDSGNVVYLLFIISTIILSTVVFWVFHGIGRVIERKVSFQVRLNYRQHLLAGVVGTDLSWHGARDSGDTIDKVNKAIDGLYRFADHIFLVVRIIVSVAGTSLVLYFFNPYISLFVVPFVFLSFFILFQFDRRLIKQYRELNIFNNRISAKIFDALSNITSIIILDVREPVLKNIHQVSLQPKNLNDKNVVLNEWKWFAGSIFFDLLLVLPLGFYIVFIYKNNLPVQIGTISALYLYLRQLSDVFFTFGGLYEDIIVQKTSVENAAVLEENFSTQNLERKTVPSWKALSITHLFFSYDEGEKTYQHLDGISLRIQRGERIACIGESGSGKTTFLKVLHGLYPTANATVTFDDGEGRTANFSDTNLHTMLVPQEPELFSSTIEENITLGVDYAKEEIEKAVELAEFGGVVRELPKGMLSVINEKGVNLSGGQKQRLALARALLFSSGKEILLLDESTSSVDPKNEARIYENIFGAFKDTTIIASIHKMNLLRYFDRIVIFDKGTITDEGTFEELLQRNVVFRENWETFVAASSIQGE